MFVRMFVTTSQPWSIICGQGWSQLVRLGLLHLHGGPVLRANIRLGQKQIAVTNTLAYQGTESIAALKSFVTYFFVII